MLGRMWFVVTTIKKQRHEHEIAGAGPHSKSGRRQLLHFNQHKNFVCFCFVLRTCCFSGDASGPAAVLLYRAGMGEGHGEVPCLLTLDVQK